MDENGYVVSSEKEEEVEYNKTKSSFSDRSAWGKWDWQATFRDRLSKKERQTTASDQQVAICVMGQKYSDIYCNKTSWPGLYTLGGSRKFPFIPLQFVRYSGSETYTQISLGIIIIEYKIAHLVSGAAKGGGGGGGGGGGSVRLSAVLRISCGISYTHLLSANITYWTLFQCEALYVVMSLN